MTRRRRHRHGAAVGLDVTADGPIPTDVRRAIDLFVDRLVRNDAAPAAVAYAVDPQTKYRYATFSFWTPFRAERAAELLPHGYKAGAQMLYLKTRVLPEAEVGSEPFAIARRIEALAELLTRSDAAPAGHRYEPDALTFLFHTPFRRDRAQALLPPSFEVDGRAIYVYTALRDDVAIGQVAGTAQSTPWTCGPAALQAVLAHHGDDVDEDTLAVLAGNVPVLGVRPTGLVKAATELGYRADCFVMRGVAALAPFLARDLPVLLVVDSWTQPGKAGHWVVATAVGPMRVRLMDPHAAGSWRTLTPAELDARWWHREGGRVVRRLALVVVPQHAMADDVAPLVDCVARGEALARGARWHRDHVSRNDALAGEVGSDKPTHGRTAHVPGPSKALVVFAKVAQAIGKAVVTFFTGSAGGKAYDALLDVTGTNVAKMNAGEKAKWFNDASNPEMYVWALSLARDKTRAWAAPPDAKADNEARAVRAITRALGLAPAAFDNLRTAMVPTLKFHLTAYCRNGTAMNAHAIQAILILFYGGLGETWPLVEAARKARPKLDWDDVKAAPAAAGWTDAVVKALEPYRTIAEGADNPDLEFA